MLEYYFYFRVLFSAYPLQGDKILFTSLQFHVNFLKYKVHYAIRTLCHQDLNVSSLISIFFFFFILYPNVTNKTINRVHISLTFLLFKQLLDFI